MQMLYALCLRLARWTRARGDVVTFDLRYCEKLWSHSVGCPLTCSGILMSRWVAGARRALGLRGKPTFSTQILPYRAAFPWGSIRGAQEGTS